jgi:hypothetical protein
VPGYGVRVIVFVFELGGDGYCGPLPHDAARGKRRIFALVDVGALVDEFLKLFEIARDEYADEVVVLKCAYQICPHFSTTSERSLHQGQFSMSSAAAKMTEASPRTDPHGGAPSVAY